MHRFTLVLGVAFAVAALAATTASANTVQRFVVSTGVVVRPFAAGTLCDFNEQETFTIDVNDEVMYDNAGNNIRIVDHQTQYVTHTNLDTGYTLTEVDHFTNFYYPPDTQTFFRTSGIVWHLRDASGHIVAVHAGTATYNFITGESTFTPNFPQDGAAVLCPALGGHPA